MLEVATNLTDLYPMKFSGSMLTLAAPQLAAGALLGSLVAGELATPQPHPIDTQSVLILSGTAHHLVEPQDREDRADRDVSLSELTRWGRSMMGGNTSNMLDI